VGKKERGVVIVVYSLKNFNFCLMFTIIIRRRGRS
jgi:hypothetical protein